jgi:hypothetical protein
MCVLAWTQAKAAGVFGVITQVTVLAASNFEKVLADL